MEYNSNSYYRERRPIGDNLYTNHVVDIVAGATITHTGMYFSIGKLISLLAYGVLQPNNFRMLL